MRTVGIICECNPVHGGHEYLIRQARGNDSEAAVICVMSGCFVQRGEAAVAQPFLRAEALIRAGASVVLELPFPYAAAGAEYFAAAGVQILEDLHIDELWFGSECGDIHALMRAAEVCESVDFMEAYKQTVTSERGTAASFFEILRCFCGEDSPISPNDILGIAYLRAILRQNARIKPITVARVGAGYHDSTLPENAFPSATALRRLWAEEGIERVAPLLPEACRETYLRAGDPFLLANAERHVLGALRLCDPEALTEIAELAGGLSNRLIDAASRAATLEELMQLAATKKYTTARISRGILFALTGIRQADLRSPVAYVRLLAGNTMGCLALAEKRASSRIRVVNHKRDLPKTPEAQRQLELDRRAWALYSLCAKKRAHLPSPWQQNPVILP